MARYEMASDTMTGGEAMGGAPDALLALGLMYATGREVQVNLVEAHKWFNIAAARGSDDAKRYRLELSGEMSKPEIAEAQRRAREWLSKH